MVNFDGKSLFPSIPISLAIETVSQKLNDSVGDTTRGRLDNQDIMIGVSLCLNTTFFTTQNKIYKQVSGIPMGSSLSPVIADLVMETIEMKAIETYHTQVKFWRRYVDDVFAILKTREVEQFHNHINNINRHI